MFAFSLATSILLPITINAAALSSMGASRNSGDRTIADVQQQCGNGQVISCCNQAGVQNNAGGIFGFIDSSQCSPIDINGVGGQVPFQQACAGNQAACCAGDQYGFVNVQCSPVTF